MWKIAGPAYQPHTLTPLFPSQPLYHLMPTPTAWGWLLKALPAQGYSTLALTTVVLRAPEDAATLMAFCIKVSIQESILHVEEYSSKYFNPTEANRTKANA